jgi:hypothetical protein
MSSIIRACDGHLSAGDPSRPEGAVLAERGGNFGSAAQFGRVASAFRNVIVAHLGPGAPLTLTRTLLDAATMSQPDLPNATAHCAKRTIANPPAIAVIAGHAIERAARHTKLRRPMDVCLQIKKCPGSGKSMQTNRSAKGGVVRAPT